MDKNIRVLKNIEYLEEVFGKIAGNDKMAVEDILTELYEWGFHDGYKEAMDYVHGAKVPKRLA